jgi:hypothetical protein
MKFMKDILMYIREISKVPSKIEVREESVKKETIPEGKFDRAEFLKRPTKR